MPPFKHDQKKATYQIINQDQHLFPFVFSIPHSGTDIPESIKKQFNADLILANIDWYLPELYAFLKDLKMTVLIQNISRYVIDPNRDIALTGHDVYTHSLVYETTTYGRAMYPDPLSTTEIETRIQRYYKPYHATLTRLIEEKLQYFDHVYLIDLHSFGQTTGVDVVLGNQHHLSMDETTLLFIKQLFEKQGFTVSLNAPYKGGYITKHYGKRGQACEALQIELAYHAYIAQRRFEEETFPAIQPPLMHNCQMRLQEAFQQFAKQYAQERKKQQ